MAIEIVDVECLECSLGCTLLGKCSMTAGKKLIKKKKIKKMKKNNEK